MLVIVCQVSSEVNSQSCHPIDGGADKVQTQKKKLTAQRHSHPPGS